MVGGSETLKLNKESEETMKAGLLGLRESQTMRQIRPIVTKDKATMMRASRMWADFFVGDWGL